MDFNAGTSNTSVANDDKDDVLFTWLVNFDRAVQLALPSTELTLTFSLTDGPRVANDPTASFTTAIIMKNDDQTGRPITVSRDHPRILADIMAILATQSAHDPSASAWIITGPSLPFGENKSSRLTIDAARAHPQKQADIMSDLANPSAGDSSARAWFMTASSPVDTDSQASAAGSPAAI
jgi:hypothetical protein